MGICRGFAFGGGVNQQEAVNLYAWLSVNAELASAYPDAMIIARWAARYDDI
jgi:hypothetical protein